MATIHVIRWGERFEWSACKEIALQSHRYARSNGLDASLHTNVQVPFKPTEHSEIDRWLDSRR